MKPILNDDLKRNLRESLIYALYANVKDVTVARNTVDDFYASLNRKGILSTYEAEEEVRKAKTQVDILNS